MEKEKLKYLKKLTERDGKKIIDILISIKNQEERLRHCYSEKFKSIESRDFVEMILLDAVFIIQFLSESKDDKGPKNFEPRMTFDIREDLMLLENQLPLFIIQEIYDQVKPPSEDATAIPFLDLATFHFGKYTFSQGVETSPSVKGSRHFTDLLRNLMLNGAIQRSYSLNPIMLKYSAVMLRKAGVKFQVTQDKCLVNIKFEKGVLKIPRLEVDHCFERLVRNIMALEQCCNPFEAHVCSYIKFMDHLIDSAEDVGLLVRKGIILNWLGDDAAVSNMINHFCENIGDNYTCFGDISQKINAHYESRFNHMKATLKLIYFPNIWRVVPLIIRVEEDMVARGILAVSSSPRFCLLLLLSSSVSNGGTVGDRGVVVAAQWLWQPVLLFFLLFHGAAAGKENGGRLRCWRLLTRGVAVGGDGEEETTVATTLGHESSLMELFVETHVRNEDRQKEVQQFVDN
ncbi:UPF0481 protein At3g47200-like [Populus alba]|uniref:UPF0481 protein At3g47200-like n=1 Tax=Populus alba TaxID=43335 RepID=UPI003CC752ED